jgi:hypothetical protein
VALLALIIQIEQLVPTLNHFTPVETWITSQHQVLVKHLSSILDSILCTKFDQAQPLFVIVTHAYELAHKVGVDF